jgi:hypothetical protein
MEQAFVKKATISQDPLIKQYSCIWLESLACLVHRGGIYAQIPVPRSLASFNLHQ